MFAFRLQRGLGDSNKANSWHGVFFYQDSLLGPLVEADDSL